MITSYVNPYRMGGYEGCGFNYNQQPGSCPCRSSSPPHAWGPSNGFEGLSGLGGVIDELGPVPKLALGVAMLAGALVILQALDKARS